MVVLNVDNSFELTYFLVAVLSSFLAAMCSAIVVFLAVKLGRTMKYTAHLQMIFVMSVFQLLYDLTFFSTVYYFGSEIYIDFSNSAQRLLGCASTMYTNYIAFVACYSLARRTFINVNAYLSWMLVVSLIPGIVFVVTYQISDLQAQSSNGYVAFRLASIALNFLMCTWSGVIVYRIRSNGSVATAEDKALSLLALRLMYYPIVQIFARGVISWYEFVYGFSFDYTHCSKSVCTALLVAIAFNPCASYGYLGIFLVMQPRAYSILRDYFPCCCTCTSPTASATASSPSFQRGSANSLKPTRDVSLGSDVVPRNSKSIAEVPVQQVTQRDIDVVDDDNLILICMGTDSFSATPSPESFSNNMRSSNLSNPFSFLFKEKSEPLLPVNANNDL